jgi:hypothetical protein
MAPFVLIGRVGDGDSAALAAALPFIVAEIDAGSLIDESSSLDDAIRRRDAGLIWTIGALRINRCPQET